MSTQTIDELPLAHPGGESVHCAMDAIYSWNYEPEIEQLRTLYANALERQWISLRDLDWDLEIDKQAFCENFSMGGLPVSETSFWRELPLETRWVVSRASSAFMLSNFLHGEQGALMVAGQMVSAVPHMDGKFYAATQTLDEARHVEAFAAYVKKMGEVQPISEGLQQLLDNVISSENWMFKAVGMQVVTEGLALYFFRDMRNQTREPLLQKLLTYVARDEARHTGYGIKYLRHVVPGLSAEQKQQIEDFAFETTRLLMASRAGLSMRDRVMQIWEEAGVDPAHALERLAAERDVMSRQLERTGGRLGPVSGFIIPTLRAIGLYSDKTAGYFKQMWTETQGPEAAQKYADSDAELPEDLELWVNAGFESL